jgi:hypothetical protein
MSDENPYQFPAQDRDRPKRQLWRMVLYGPSNPWAFVVPLAILAIVALAGFVIDLLVK